MSPGTWERDPATEVPSVDPSPDQGTASTHDDTPSGYRPCMMAHALDDARAGHAVLLLQTRGKRPVTDNGKDDATTDVELLRDLCVQHPGANNGWCPPEGTVVVDVDTGDGGAQALYELTRPHGGLIPTLTAWTGGGGLHAWYRAPGPYKRKLCRGVDLKSHTGYVVVPPSLHASGRRYVWANDLPIADAPPWLVALMRKPVMPLRPVLGVLGGVASARADDALVGVVARARSGGRNSALHWAACRAAERGSPPALVAKLARAGAEVGLPADEIERTLTSAAGVSHA